MNNSVYAKIPDNQLKLTENGVSQAIVSIHSYIATYGCYKVSFIVHNQRAGEELKELVGNEMVTFYVSPYLRSRLTYKYIRRAFLDEQVSNIISCFHCS